MTTIAVSVAEGESKDVVVASLPNAEGPPPSPSVPDSPAPLPRPSAPPSAHSSARHTAAWVMGASGAAAVAGSLVFGGVVLEDKSIVANHCKDKQCDPAGLSAGKSGTAFAAAATVSFVVGIVALGGGLYLGLTAPAPSSAGTSVLLRGTF